MNPDELSEYLRVIKEGGALRADVTLDGRGRIVVEFAPTVIEPLPGDAPEPESGGWKALPRLDDPAGLWPHEPTPTDVG